MWSDEHTGQMCTIVNSDETADEHDKDEAALEIQWAALKYLEIKRKQESDDKYKKVNKS